MFYFCYIVTVLLNQMKYIKNNQLMLCRWYPIFYYSLLEKHLPLSLLNSVLSILLIGKKLSLYFLNYFVSILTKQNYFYVYILYILWFTFIFVSIGLQKRRMIKLSQSFGVQNPSSIIIKLNWSQLFFLNP